MSSNPIINTVTHTKPIHSDEQIQDFKAFFLTNTEPSLEQYREMVNQVTDNIITQISTQTQPYSGRSPQSLWDEVKAIQFFPEKGLPLAEVIEKTRALVIEHNVAVSHPFCLAHLHCPIFTATLAAEMIISAFNQSLDSFDQSPAASMIEQALCDELCKIFGLGLESDALFTSGGTMSNFMALLLARDHYATQHFNWNIQKQGFFPEISKFRIICSEYAHFSVIQSASILGLGEQAVVSIKADHFSEEASLLQATILELKNQGLLPIAYVTTAGTTDFGSIGNISALADSAHQHGLWFHIDAAFGGALIFSEQHKHKLAGIEKADSITIDFHKLFYQPISCGAFMLKDKKHFNYIRLHADYLNPESNAQQGILDLVYKSIQTTRRFDALKPFISLQHVGVKKLGEMIDYTISLASSVNHLIEADPQLELAQHGMLNTVLFRYLPHDLLNSAASDVLNKTNAINNQIKTTLLLSGKAIIGQTMIGEKAFLKLTLLNPGTQLNELTALLDLIKQTGAQIALELKE